MSVFKLSEQEKRFSNFAHMLQLTVFIGCYQFFYTMIPCRYQEFRLMLSTYSKFSPILGSKPFFITLRTFWIFAVCAPPPPPSLVGAYYLHPPDARAIFLHSDLLCNGTCSVTGGA